MFRKYDAEAYCVTYGGINKTGSQLEVNFKMNRSKNMIFQPSKGTVKTIIPPKGLAYLSTSILDPGMTSFSYNYSFTSKKI